MFDCLAGWEGKQERTKEVCGTRSGGSKELREFFPVVMMNMTALLVGLCTILAWEGGLASVFIFLLILGGTWYFVLQVREGSEMGGVRGGLLEGMDAAMARLYH